MIKSPSARASQTCTKERRCALRTGSLCRKTMNGGAMEPITDPIADHRSVWKALPLVMGGQSARRRSLRSLLVDQQRCAACGSWGVARTVESDLGGRRSCVSTRAVAHRAGGQQWAADAAGQGAILACADPEFCGTEFRGPITHRQSFRGRAAELRWSILS